MRLFPVLLGSLLLALVLALSSCAAEDPQPDPTYTWTFVNHATVRVYVEPNGTDFDDFFLDPDSSVRVTTDTSYIQYAYSPSNQVYAVNSSGTIAFYNR